MLLVIANNIAGPGLIILTVATAANSNHEESSKVPPMSVVSIITRLSDHPV